MMCDDLADAILRDPTTVASLAPDQFVNAARALKDRALLAWSGSPAEIHAIRSAADALLRAMKASGTTDVDLVAGLGQWITALACLVESRLNEAIIASDEAAHLLSRGQAVGDAANARLPKFIALSMMGRVEEALTCAEYVTAQMLAADDKRGAAKIGRNIGLLLKDHGRAGEAVTHFREAHSLFGELGDVHLAAQTLVGLGDALAAMGEIAEALSCFRSARVFFSGVGQEFSFAVAIESESILLTTLGQYAQSLQLLLDAIATYDTLNAAGPKAVAHKLLGDTYLSLNLTHEAATSFRAALAHFDHLGMQAEGASARVQLARALLHEPGDAASKNALVDSSLNDAAQYYRRIDDPMGQANVDLVRAEHSMQIGQAADAVAAAQAAQANGNTAGAPAVIARALLMEATARRMAGDLRKASQLAESALASASALGLPSLRARSSTECGLTLEMAGEIEAASEHFETAIADIEALWSDIPARRARQTLLADHLSPYEGQVRTALHAHENDATPARALAVVLAVERYRARTFGQRSTVETSSRVRSVRARLDWLYRRHDRAMDRGENPSATEDAIRHGEAELREALLREEFVQSATDPSHKTAALHTVAALQAQLRPRDVIVQYGVAADELFACVVHRDRVQVHRRIASWSTVEQAIRAVRLHIDTMLVGSQRRAAHAPQLTSRATAALKKLRERIIAPLEDDLRHCERALIVPHGGLAAVPFVALDDDTNGWLAQASLALAPSLSVAAQLLGIPHRPAMFDAATLVVADTQRLVHADAEAMLVSRHFAPSQMLLGDQATATALHEWAGQARLLHLACHGAFRTDNPMFSALRLADGQLTAMDIESLHLPESLVVLSACESGSADNALGDELVGLVRAFLTAGAARVLACHWPVDDEVALEFMTHFYGALRTAPDVSAALRGAQTALRRTHPHPYFWSTFALFGGW